ncbi:Hypothetical protein R9X50_00045100 [Acrodontium crateriforme]|uniref:Uncharacterized protein n=1 Tax=Acrodontium crateriforme TaxID=150365 RepID=A0AAQ3LXA4_9PEZI|nr:Hypothetical protein R9X50_00045100 [Acrodontium crateriforme]
MNESTETAHWLHKYGNVDYYAWRDIAGDNGSRIFHRPIGLVESTFDTDGRHYEGRADMSVEIEIEIRSELSSSELRKKLLFTWACLRNEHALLQAKSMPWNRALQQSHTALHFFIGVPETSEAALSSAADHLVFLEDHYEVVDRMDFWIHCQNGSRILDPNKALSKMFIHSAVSHSNGNITLRVLIVGGHMIWDGLSSAIWARNYVQLLNLSSSELEDRLSLAIRPENIKRKLPLPQEALYPPINGSKARKRWFWLLTRILRHVRKPLPAGFPNPLRRHNFRQPVALSPLYTAVLDYSRVPPLNTFPSFMRASLADTDHLHRLCREAKVSIGSGCFALTALIMMEMYERLQPDIPLSERQPFITGFPINPRAFFNHHNEPDSCMLAFCEGIILPFLPSSLDLNGRIRLLARQAHRQLSAYQKRVRPAGEEAKLQYMSTRGAGRVLANQYLLSLERANSNLPPHLREANVNPHGNYPARLNFGRPTCGVSSVGRREGIVSQKLFDVNDKKDFVASCKDLGASVRAREGEFLVGVGGDEKGLCITASVDGSNIDPALVALFKDRLETVLTEPRLEAEKGKL